MSEISDGTVGGTACPITARNHQDRATTVRTIDSTGKSTSEFTTIHKNGAYSVNQANLAKGITLKAEESTGILNTDRMMVSPQDRSQTTGHLTTKYTLTDAVVVANEDVETVDGIATNDSAAFTETIRTVRLTYRNVGYVISGHTKTVGGKSVANDVFVNGKKAAASDVEGLL